MTTYLSQWPTIIGVGERGVMGAPRSHHRRGIADHGPSPGPTRRRGRLPGRSIVTAREASSTAMLRIIHTADVHLGARHDDLGEQAAAQRERQFAAFKAAIDLALAEKVDLFLIAGDLFDSNVQPRRSVERVAAELKRLAEARIRSVIIPGTHDVYDRASIYRAYDLAALAGCAPDDDLVTVLDPEHPWVHLGALDAVVHGRVFATKRAPHSPLEGLSAASAGTAEMTPRHRRPRPGGSGWSTARSPSRAGPSTTRS